MGNTNKIKVAILGGTGMLGYTVSRYLSLNKDLDITVYSRKSNLLNENKKLVSSVSNRVLNLDLKSIDDWYDRPHEYYDYTINCVGLIKPYIGDDTDQTKIELAVQSNILFPYTIAKMKNLGKIISIATDCVFDGLTGGYTETCQHDALDVYGKTKSLGEVKSANWMNIRCSIIGHEFITPGKSLLSWVLSQKGQTINGFMNHLWNGVTTLEFAKICEKIITQKIDVPNLVHIDGQVITKYRLLRTIDKVYNLGITVNEMYSTIYTDRTLATEYPEISHKLFDRYLRPLSLQIQEMYEFEKNY